MTIDHAEERAALRKIMTDRGYQYGNDAFENVYLGWRLAKETALEDAMTTLPSWGDEPPADLGRFNCSGQYRKD